MDAMTEPKDEMIRMLIGEQRRLQAYIRSLVGHRHLVDDIMQEVAVVVMRRSETFEPGSNFFAWVREIARRVALAELRRHGHGISLDPALAGVIVDQVTSEAAIWENERTALRACLQRLPGDSRRLLAMRYVDDLPSEEIASRIGRSLDGAKSLLKRVRAQILECMRRRLPQADRTNP
jgi:RNA polymerase sigma-70 factor (ECF subfamily)